MKLRATLRSLAAGVCGAAAHSLLMYGKARFAILPTFDPYQSLQASLTKLIGGNVHPLVPWALSFFSGATMVGLLFGRVYPLLPGRSGIAKGLLFGLLGWALMNVLFFPIIGLGAFALAAGLGSTPSLLSLAMPAYLWRRCRRCLCGAERGKLTYKPAVGGLRFGQISGSLGGKLTWPASSASA